MFKSDSPEFNIECLQPLTSGLFLLNQACSLMVGPFAGSSKLSYATTLYSTTTLFFVCFVLVYLLSLNFRVYNFIFAHKKVIYLPFLMGTKYLRYYRCANIFQQFYLHMHIFTLTLFSLNCQINMTFQPLSNQYLFILCQLLQNGTNVGR